MKNKILGILLNSAPVLLMVGLVSYIRNDYYLAIVFIIIIFFAFKVKKERNDITVFFFGLVMMTFFEYIFLLNKVEVFNRNSLFGIMPLWLPILWAYGFVAIKRCVQILGR